jgi:RNA polymerase sigma-70 factor (ECF subfamily)
LGFARAYEGFSLSINPTQAQYAELADLEGLYRRYSNALRRYVARAFGAGPPDPEDVVHAAFEKYACVEDKAQVANPEAFLKITARNYVLDQRRRAKVRSDHAAETLCLSDEGDDLNAERVLSAKERWDILERAIRSMDRRRQEVLIMNRIHGISFAEIARLQGFSPSLAKQLFAQALVICERALREGGGE